LAVNRPISTRDFVKIHEAAALLGVTEQTLRNWDRARKLKPVRHPINGYRMYRVADLHSILGELERSESQSSFEFDAATSDDFGASVHAPDATGLFDFDAAGNSEVPQQQRKTDADRLPPCHWSLEVALDPKHRPQQWNAPATTVRRDWRKFPQEAHVLDVTGTKYRRFSPSEVALLQGFDPQVIEIPHLTDRERIGAMGDAVPPPLAQALVRGIEAQRPFSSRTAIEICAGAGGLAEGAAAIRLEHLLLVDASVTCEAILKHDRPWPANSVKCSDVRKVDFMGFRGRVGLLSGGPPCQPWSRSGFRRGNEDDRDLLGSLPSIVAAIEPEAFLFENVPGLASEQNRAYLNDVIRRLQAPDRHLKYSVLIGIFNAADYGVPQIRERLFIVGLKDAPAVLVSRCFDEAESLQTHQQPGGMRAGLKRWRTIGDVLEGRGDPGGWRRWIVRS
jgi:site-specific DNA-cytosine methylase